MGENGVDDAMIKLICEALKPHVRLHMLFMDNNRITANGSEALAECLKNKQDLRVLNVDHNKIGSEGATKLAEQLK